MARQALLALGTSVFAHMTRLAETHGAINLAQGFPDFGGPDLVKSATVAALDRGLVQYARSQGVVPLVEAIAGHQAQHYGLQFDPMTEVVATAGATEAIAAAFLGLLEPGDEVILFEPFYDSYRASIAMAGAVPVAVPLRWPDFALDVDELARSITPNTKALLLNTPHNPTGKVFSHDELSAIAQLCHQHDLWVLSDEVYEHLTYGVPHTPMATMPGMKARTLTVSSAGKTFSTTGYKVGWATGPSDLVAGVQRAHQFLTFCAATPLHYAMADVLRAADAEFFSTLTAEFVARRDALVTMLREAGFVPSVPRGAYFVLAEFSALSNEDDVTFAERLTREARVCAIPPSAFYRDGSSDGRRLLRFAFCKRAETLDAARERLLSWCGSRAP